MAKTRFIQNSFTSGVLSPLLKGRTDIQQYYNALEAGENVVLIPQGGLKRRPGTQHIDEALPIMQRNTTAPTMPNGGTAANINDEDDSTTTATTNPIGAADPYVVAEYDLGTEKFIEYIDLRGVSLSTGSSINFRVSYSPNGSTWLDALNPAYIIQMGTDSQDFRLRVRRSARYWRFEKISAEDLGAAVVNIAEFNLWEKTTTNSSVQLKEFAVSTDNHYLLSFTDKNCYIYEAQQHAFVAAVKVPYASTDIGQIRDVQSEGVIILFHEDYEPVRITNLGTNADWFVDNPPIINVPEYDFDDSSSPTPVSEVQVMTFSGFVAGDQFQIDVEGVLSKNITFAGDATADERSATEENIRKNLQDMPNFGTTGISVSRTGANQYTITIADESADDFELFSAFATSGTASKTITFTKSATGTARKEPVWSATRGWPKTACYYNGRLIIGGTKSKPQSIFASKAGEPFNFELDESDDNDAIFATISSRKLSDITDVFPGRDLQIFTAGSEYAVLTSPLTPQTFNVVPQTSHGTKYLAAKEIDGATIMIDRNGKTLREFLYSFNEDAYTANDISVLSPELIKNPVEYTILGGTQSEDANWVFIVNEDGTATVLNTLRSQDINGFTSWTTDGSIKSVAVVDTELYMVVERDVNGTLFNHVERWSFDYPVDDGGYKTGGGGTFTSISSLDWLEGEEIAVVGDGSYLGDFTVSGGSITLTDPVSEAYYGRKFTPTVKPMPVATNVGSGSNVMRLKKIVRMNIRVKDTAGLYIDGNPTAVRSFGDSSDSPLDAPPEQRTGIIDDVYPIGGWGRDNMPVITQPDPMPFTILAIEYEVESS